MVLPRNRFYCLVWPRKERFLHKSRKVARRRGERGGREASPLFIRGWIFQARFDSVLITAIINKTAIDLHAMSSFVGQINMTSGF